MEHIGISLNAKDVERDELEVDVLLVGAGPANLACAIHLQRLLKEKGIEDKTILVLDKAEEVGHHTLSGAVMNPRGIAELYPDWRDRGFPVESDMKGDAAVVMWGEKKHTKLQGIFVPPQFRNHGNVIVSLNKAVRWMKEQAEEAGCEVYPGFAAAQVLAEGTRVVGVQTRDSGIAKDGSQKPSFEPGMNIKAKVTVMGEGVRGHLAKHLIRHFKLDAGKNPQTYGTGIKELWEVPEERGKEMLGQVLHTGGYPLGGKGYGGSWIYGLPDNKISLGFVVGLDHPDARLDPHALFVRWKQHPFVQKLLAGGKVIRYGAKAVPEGGYFAMPRLYGDGFVLVGDTAGFLNAATLKGIHLGIKSGMLAAEAIVEAIASDDTSATKLESYQSAFESSWAKDELYKVRNYRQSFDGGLVGGMLDVGLQMITGGRGFFARRKGHADHSTTQRPAASKMEKPKFDDSGSMDKLTDVYWSGTLHEEDQPPHLLITDPSICLTRCTEEYGNPCKDFCPAAVYEWTEESKTDGVMINFSNCVHCKTCDIADPYQIIEWVVPEGGGGPKYVDM